MQSVPCGDSSGTTERTAASGQMVELLDIPPRQDGNPKKPGEPMDSQQMEIADFVDTGKSGKWLIGFRENKAR